MKKNINIFFWFIIPIFVTGCYLIFFAADPATGYTGKLLIICYIISAAALVISASAGWLAEKGMLRYDIHKFDGTFFCVLIIAAFLTVGLSVWQIVEPGYVHPFRELFSPYAVKNTEELIKARAFRFNFITAVLGFLSAFWMMMTAMWQFRGKGDFIGGRFMSVIPVLWSCMRILGFFVEESINPKDIRSLILMLSLALLTLFFARYARHLSLGTSKSEVRGFVFSAVSSFLICCGLSLPALRFSVYNHDTGMTISMILNFTLGLAAWISVIKKKKAAVIKRINRVRKIKTDKRRNSVKFRSDIKKTRFL